MSHVNLSAVLHGINDLRMEERPVKEPGPGDVQLSVYSVGICGSDVTVYNKGGIGRFRLSDPIVLGHECSGIVSKVGEGVTHLKIGDRVAVEPGVPCRRCELCKNGRYNICPKQMFPATPPDDGFICQTIVHPADFCFKLPDHVSLEEGALLEPLSVGIHACRRGGVTLGHNMFICGAGPIGLACMLTAKAMGVGKVIFTDISQHRLDFAKKLGADHCVLVKTSDEAEEVAERVTSEMGCMPDVTIECSGAEAGVRTGVYATKRGGVVIQVALGVADVSVPIVEAAFKEIEIRGVVKYANTWPAALDMVASGLVNIKSLISHHFALDETVEAFAAAKKRADGTIKVIIDCFRFKESSLK